MNDPTATYAQSGVDTDGEERGMAKLGAWVSKSFGLRPGLGRPVLPLGHYANVIALNETTGIAVSADGVGTKIFIAEMMDRYDSVGIDCVAMNVNDLVCIGAEPLAMLDYLAVQAPHERLLDELGQGLYRACELANITVPGGEVAQVREMIKGHRDGWSFDLVGTAVGEGDIDMKRAYEIFRTQSQMERINIETEMAIPLDDMETALRLEIDAVQRSIRYCREVLGIR